jgi:hypothetical protein
LQFAFAQQSLQNTALNQAYPEGLKPVFPVSNHPRATPAYPKIFVEPRLNEVANAAQRPSAMEIAQQYRQRQEFRLKQQASLPTPPSSSSPQWSSNFSPYQYPSVSPEMDIQNTLGLPHNTQQAQRPFIDASHQARFLYDRQDSNIETRFFDGDGGCGSMLSHHDRDVPSAVNPHPSDISGGFANYLRDLHALASQQPRYASTAELPLTAARHPVNTGRTFVSVAPPSPESPGSRSRSISYQQPRSVPLARLIQRRLSSVPEEELSVLAATSSTSAYQSADCHQRSLSSRDYSDDNTTPRRYHQEQHLSVPAVDHARVHSPDSIHEYEAQPYSFPHGASPAKVRLPSAQEREEYLYQSRIQSRSNGGDVVDTSQQLKKKPRGRKTKSNACPASAR